jgi:hypothetical protein
MLDYYPRTCICTIDPDCNSFSNIADNKIVKVLGIGKSGATYLGTDLDLINSPFYVVKKIQNADPRVLAHDCRFNLIGFGSIKDLASTWQNLQDLSPRQLYRVILSRRSRKLRNTIEMLKSSNIVRQS